MASPEQPSFPSTPGAHESMHWLGTANAATEHPTGRSCLTSTGRGMKLKGGGMSTCTSMRPSVRILLGGGASCLGGLTANVMATSRLNRSFRLNCARSRGAKSVPIWLRLWGQYKPSGCVFGGGGGAVEK